MTTFLLLCYFHLCDFSTHIFRQVIDAIHMNGGYSNQSKLIKQKLGDQYMHEAEMQRIIHTWYTWMVNEPYFWNVDISASPVVEYGPSFQWRYLIPLPAHVVVSVYGVHHVSTAVWSYN